MQISVFQRDKKKKQVAYLNIRIRFLFKYKKKQKESKIDLKDLFQVFTKVCVWSTTFKIEVNERVYH